MECKLCHSKNSEPLKCKFCGIVACMRCQFVSNCQTCKCYCCDNCGTTCEECEKYICDRCHTNYICGDCDGEYKKNDDGEYVETVRYSAE